MRTTLNIDLHLLASAKAVAVRRKCSVGTIVEDALREVLTPASRSVPVARCHDLPEGGLGGLVPGIDIDHGADLLAVMENDDGAYGRQRDDPRLSRRHA